MYMLYDVYRKNGATEVASDVAEMIRRWSEVHVAHFLVLHLVHLDDYKTTSKTYEGDEIWVESSSVFAQINK